MHWSQAMVEAGRSIIEKQPQPDEMVSMLVLPQPRQTRTQSFTKGLLDGHTALACFPPALPFTRTSPLQPQLPWRHGGVCHTLRLPHLATRCLTWLPTA